jgi:hypothetical protein
MDWELVRWRLLLAERLVVEAEGFIAQARQAARGAKDGNGLTIDAEAALKTMEVILERRLEARDQLRDELRILTH